MAVSIVVGAAVSIYFKSLACGVASFLAGVFLDIDHLFDCYLNHGPHFRLEDLYSYCQEIKFKRLSLIFHSYELLAIFWILTFALSLSSIWIAIAIGATQHVIFDQLANVLLQKMDNRAYFLIFRLKNGFRKEGIVKGR